MATRKVAPRPSLLEVKNRLLKGDVADRLRLEQIKRTPRWKQTVGFRYNRGPGVSEFKIIENALEGNLNDCP
jgi:hypothetical protein